MTGKMSEGFWATRRLDGQAIRRLGQSGKKQVAEKLVGPRLLKKVQMSLDFARDREPVERQGGVTHPADGYPARCEAYLARTSQRRTHRPDGYPARGVPVRRMGPCRWAFFSSLLEEAAAPLGGPPGRQVAKSPDCRE